MEESAELAAAVEGLRGEVLGKSWIPRTLKVRLPAAQAPLLRVHR